MPGMALVFKKGIDILRNTMSVIRTEVIETKRGEVDARVLSLAARLVVFLEKLASMLELISRRIGESGEKIVQIAPYTYVFQVNDQETVFMRTRAEHLVISINTVENIISVKSRRGVLEVSAKLLKIKARGVNVTINLAEKEQYKEKLSEIRNTLRIFENYLYRKLNVIAKIEKK
jgi:hypothetical protein